YFDRVLFALALLLFRLRLRGGLRQLGSLERAGLVGLLDRLQHDVRFEQLADVRLQLESWQLQKANGLLQLRGHGQVLTQLELQGRFQDGMCMGRQAPCQLFEISYVSPLPEGPLQTERLAQVHLTHLWVGKDFFRSPGCDYRSLVDDIGAPADAQCFADVM